MTRLEDLLAVYSTHWTEERAYLPAFQELLVHPSAYERTHLPGHITGSAWVLNRKLDAVALVLHAKLRRWMQPGGHADGEHDILKVALRETQEETGLDPEPVSGDIFDIDIHTIPARPDFPEHLHFDVRFCFRATDERLTISDESLDLRWIKLDRVFELTESPSIIRMVEKSRVLM